MPNSIVVNSLRLCIASAASRGVDRGRPGPVQLAMGEVSNSVIDETVYGLTGNQVVGQVGLKMRNERERPATLPQSRPPPEGREGVSPTLAHAHL